MLTCRDEFDGVVAAARHYALRPDIMQNYPSWIVSPTTAPAGSAHLRKSSSMVWLRRLLSLVEYLSLQMVMMGTLLALIVCVATAREESSRMEGWAEAGGGSGDGGDGHLAGLDGLVWGSREGGGEQKEGGVGKRKRGGGVEMAAAGTCAARDRQTISCATTGQCCCPSALARSAAQVPVLSRPPAPPPAHTAMRSPTPPRSPPLMPSTSSMMRHSCRHEEGLGHAVVTH